MKPYTAPNPSVTSDHTIKGLRDSCGFLCMRDQTSVPFSVRSAIAVTYIQLLWDWSHNRWHGWWCNHRFTSHCSKINIARSVMVSYDWVLL